MVEVKLDYDHDNWESLFYERKSLVESILGVKLENVRFYRSKGGNHHVRAEIKEKKWMPGYFKLDILAIQLLMGSDPTRECFNLRRIWRGQKNWNILFTEGVEEIEV